MDQRLLSVSAAEEYLSFAFEHCHRSSQKNKRMILIYLLPVKMLLVSGAWTYKAWLPSTALFNLENGTLV